MSKDPEAKGYAGQGSGTSNRTWVELRVTLVSLGQVAPGLHSESCVDESGEGACLRGQTTSLERALVKADLVYSES